MNAADGTVAFLLCDIEGSTPLVHEAGADYATILNGVRRIIRDAVTTHGGTVIDAFGDELFAAFGSLDDGRHRGRRGPARADRGAVARRPRRPGADGGPHRRAADHRRGLHRHRRPSRRPHRVGRARRADPPLVDGLLADGFAVRDLGSHRLAGLPEPEHIHQLLADGLPARLPAAAEHDRHARKRDDGGDRRGLGPAPRGRRPAARRVGLRGRRPVRQRRRPAPPRRDAQARGRDRRHPDAADAHRRRARGGARDPRRLPGHRRARALAVRRARLRGRACSRTAPRASATCSRTGSPTWRSSPRPCAASARAARRSIRRSSASSSAAAAPTTRSTPSPRASARCSS